MKSIFCITILIKYIFALFNIANIGVIIYTIFYVDEILPKNKVVIFILFEIFFFYENVYSYYFHDKS